MASIIFDNILDPSHLLFHVAYYSIIVTLKQVKTKQKLIEKSFSSE